MKKILCIILSLLTFIFVFCACGKQTDEETTVPAGDKGEGNSFFNFDKDNSEEITDSSDRTKILFTMENGDTFVIALYPEYAPITCKNFEKLVSEGFYDGLTFHRVVKNFMAQGGCPNGDGSGSTDPIKGEFAVNGYGDNMLSHKRGVVSMGRRSNDYDSASCQFFICYTDCSFLDGQYAAFGKVIEGMDTVDDFLDGEFTYGSDGKISKPVEPIVIKSAVILENTEAAN